MKLYNQTAIPDAILDPLLTLAGRSVRARTGGVVVRLAKTSRGIHGLTHSCSRVRVAGQKRMIRTDCADIQLWIPSFVWYRDTLDWATQIYEIAAHEWAHVFDAQEQARGKYVPMAHRVNGRRCAWKRRPEELRAQDAAHDAMPERQPKLRRERIEDAIIALALYIDEEKVKI